MTHDDVKECTQRPHPSSRCLAQRVITQTSNQFPSPSPYADFLKSLGFGDDYSIDPASYNTIDQFSPATLYQDEHHNE